MNLNEQQKKIVNTPPGKIAIIAGAGSGKTSTTLCLIEKKYIDDGVSLEKMWITTFTNKAARDLKSKLKLKLGLSDMYLNKLWVGTFHSLGFRYLTQVRGLKLTIILPVEAKHLLKNIYKQIINDGGDYDEDSASFSDLADAIEVKRNKDCKWEGVTDFPDVCEKMLFMYQSEKKKQNIVDYDDILELFVEQLKQDDYFRNKFDWVFVDECFPYSTPVFIDYDKWVPIGEIVENPENYKETLSYDLIKKEIIKKEIGGYLKKEINYPILIRIKLRLENGDECYIDSTEYHKMWVVGKGETVASKVKVGDKFINLDYSKFKRASYCHFCKKVVKTASGGHLCAEKINLRVKKVCPECGKSSTSLKKHIFWVHRASKKTKNLRKRKALEFWNSNKSEHARSVLAKLRKIDNPMFDADIRKKVGDKVKETFWKKPKKEREIQIKRFMDAPKHTKKPNNIEKKVIFEHIDNLYFTGDGSYFLKININGKIKAKNPDYIYVPFKCGTCSDFSICKQKDSNLSKTTSCNNWKLAKSYRTNKVVEIMDFEYWHKIEEIEPLKKAYSEKGIYCLILDAKLPIEEKRSKIESFINNHYCDVLSIKKIFPKKKKIFVYDLNIPDTHLFFIGGLKNPISRYSQTLGFSTKNIVTPILVHNCQDNNAKQNTLSELLSKKSLVMVGDSKQSIYQFRGATPNLFKEKIKTAEHIYPLAYNYRSSKEIIDLANVLIKQIPYFASQELIAVKSSGPKPVFTICGDMSLQIFQGIKKDLSLGIPPHEIAVLARSVKSVNIQAILGLLRSAQIPYRLRGGDDKYNAAYVQNYLSVLKSICAPTKVSYMNSLSLLPGVGAKTAMVLSEDIISKGITTVASSGKKYVESKGFQDYQKLFDLKNKRQELITKSLDFIHEHYLTPVYGKKSKEEPSIKRSLIYDLLHKHLMAAPSIAEGIDSLYINEEDSESEKDKVIISTVHSSKGLEHESVHIANFMEHSMPFLKDEDNENEDRLEEEFCIAYVAITRAKKYLKMYMEHASNRGTWIKENELSRYISEIYKNFKESFFTLKVLDVADENLYKYKLFESLCENKVDNYEDKSLNNKNKKR